MNYLFNDFEDRGDKKLFTSGPEKAWPQQDSADIEKETSVGNAA